jgi:hypothetical protein
MSEAGLQDDIRLAVGGRAVLFRNNTGMAWSGESRRLPDGSILVRNPRPLHAGLCRGSSDLVGWRSVVITQDMVGQRLAVFCAIEVKSPRGRATEEQQKFLANLRAAGGFAGLARSVKEALEALGL